MSTTHRIASDLLAVLALVALGLALPASQRLARSFLGAARPEAAAAPEAVIGARALTVGEERCAARLATLERTRLGAAGAHRFCDGDTLITVEAGTVVRLR